MSFSRWSRPVAFALGGSLLTWGASLLISDRYTSTALIRLGVEPYPSADTINQAYQDTVNRQSLKSVIQRLNLYPEERERLPLEDVMEAMKEEDLSSDFQKDEVKVSFAYRDPGVSQAVANEFAKILMSTSEAHYREQPQRGRLALTNAAAPGQATEVFAFWRPRRYVAHATLEVRDRYSAAIPKEEAEKRCDDFVANALSPVHLAMLVAGDHFATRPIEREDLDLPFPESHRTGPSTESGVTLDELRKHLRLDRKSNIVFVKFTHSDAKVAQRTVNHLIKQLSRENAAIPRCEPPYPVTSVSYPPGRAELCREPNTPTWLGSFDLLDPASLPAEPDGPSRPILAAAGLFLGLGLWATNFKS